MPVRDAKRLSGLSFQRSTWNPTTKTTNNHRRVMNSLRGDKWMYTKTKELLTDVSLNGRLAAALVTGCAGAVLWSSSLYIDSIETAIQSNERRITTDGQRIAVLELAHRDYIAYKEGHEREHEYMAKALERHENTNGHGSVITRLTVLDEKVRRLEAR